MIFEKVVGHIQVKKQLETAVKTGKVSHAYIFAGKRGVGKNTMAKEFAHVLTDGSVADVTLVTNEHYGIESKTDTVSVDTVRAASSDMYMKPYLADRRVFIIPNAEKMNQQAQNALLKIFEEPPSYCVIILVTQNDNILLPTIRSRAVTVRFGELDDNQVKDYMSKNGKEVSDIIVRIASGSIGMVQSLCENEELSEVLNNFVELFKTVGKGTSEVTHGLIDFIQKEKANYEPLFDIMLVMLQDTLHGKENGLKIDGLNSKKAVRIIELVEKTRNSFLFNADYNMAVSEMMLNILGETND